MSNSRTNASHSASGQNFADAQKIVPFSDPGLIERLFAGLDQFWQANVVGPAVELKMLWQEGLAAIKSSPNGGTLQVKSVVELEADGDGESALANTSERGKVAIAFRGVRGKGRVETTATITVNPPPAPPTPYLGPPP